jgi:hypothetical protein
LHRRWVEELVARSGPFHSLEELAGHDPLAAGGEAAAWDLSVGNETV